MPPAERPPCPSNSTEVLVPSRTIGVGAPGAPVAASARRSAAIYLYSTSMGLNSKCLGLPIFLLVPVRYYNIEIAEYYII